MYNLTKQIGAWTFIINFIVLLCLYDFVSEIYPPPKPHPNHIHTTIYIDSSFDEFEQEAIIEAALEWTSTTNHIVEYDIVQLPTNEDIDMDNSLIISNITPDFPIVLALDTTNKKTTLGFFDKKSIIPNIGLISRRIENEDFKSVVMHELGHSLGLDHNEGADGMDTLMYPSRNILFNAQIIKSGADHLTLKDGQKFCKLYNCDATKLKYQKESFHF